MRAREKYYLNIVISSLNNDQNSLFKCISSINNQIGFDLKKNVLITLITTIDRESLTFDLTLFNKINFNWIKVNNDEPIDQLNNVLDDNNSIWITFMNSNDLLFADGSLLDFMVHSKEQLNDKDILVFNYVYPIKNENEKVVDFGSSNFLNFIFGKYFKLSYLTDNQIYFNYQLHQYLTDDYSSRAIELSDRTIWFDLNNYYLSSLPNTKDNFSEFCLYRKFFISFMKDHSNDSQQLINDICWSIVHAFNMINDDGLNDSNRSKLMELFNFIKEYQGYNMLLEKEFNNLGVFNDFKKFMEG